MRMPKTSLPFSVVCCVGAWVLVGCGGAESSGITPDASPDIGGDTLVIDAPSDAPSDVPTPRAPKNHRPSATTCAPSTGSGGGVCGSVGGGPPGACKKDGDCTAGTNGHCNPSGGGVLMCSCFYDACKSDAECTSGGPCACQGSPYQNNSNGCAPAGNCKVDADCGPKGFCSPTGNVGCSGALGGYFCHTAADECIDDDDCSKTSGPQACTYDSAKKHWGCVPILACA